MYHKLYLCMFLFFLPNIKQYIYPRNLYYSEIHMGPTYEVLNKPMNRTSQILRFEKLHGS